MALGDKAKVYTNISAQHLADALDKDISELGSSFKSPEQPESLARHSSISPRRASAAKTTPLEKCIEQGGKVLIFMFI